MREFELVSNICLSSSTRTTTSRAPPRHLKRGHPAGVLHNLQPSEHVASRVRQSLALLGGDDGGELVHVGADELLVSKHDARARGHRRVFPSREGCLTAGHRLVELGAGAGGHRGVTDQVAFERRSMKSTLESRFLQYKYKFTCLPF